MNLLGTALTLLCSPAFSLWISPSSWVQRICNLLLVITADTSKKYDFNFFLRKKMNHVVFPGQTVPSSVRWLCNLKSWLSFYMPAMVKWLGLQCRAPPHQDMTSSALRSGVGLSWVSVCGNMFPVRAEKISGRDNNFSFCSTAVFDENTSVENSKLMVSLLLSQESHLVENNFILLWISNKIQQLNFKKNKKKKKVVHS